VTRSGHRLTRGHLSLACAPSAPPASPSRAALVARALLARMSVLLHNLLALVGALIALLPLLFRRGPLGHRTQVPRVAARIITFQPRRRASPP
jgi:hypothetical protein